MAPQYIPMPDLCCDTTWYSAQTRTLVYQALRAGFRGIDTAAQPSQYREDLAGDGMRDAIQAGILRRKNLHVQTKFTPVDHQLPDRMPYHPNESIWNQVAASLFSSLINLRPADGPGVGSYVDCLVLHYPLRTREQTQEAWRAMECHVPDRARTLGVSNITLSELESLYHFAKVKPSIVQNEFRADALWDSGVRKFCREKRIVYQTFPDPILSMSPPVKILVGALGVSPEAALFALVLELGEPMLMSVLDRDPNYRARELDLLQVAAVGAGIKSQAINGFRRLVNS